MQTRAALNFICPIETRNYIFSHDQMMRPWCVASGPAAMCKITLYQMHFAALGGARGGAESVAVAATNLHILNEF